MERLRQMSGIENTQFYCISKTLMHMVCSQCPIYFHDLSSKVWNMIVMMQ